MDVSIARKPIDDTALNNSTPLSLQQLFYWNFIQRGVFSESFGTFALRISGPLDVQKFREGIEAMTEEHELLRSRIVLVGDVPKLTREGRGEPAVEVFNLEADGDGDLKARHFIEVLTSRESGLVRRPLSSVKLLRLGETTHVLVWTIHHIIYDGVSIRMMFREVWLNYVALLHGRPCYPSRRRSRYSDYAIWQQQSHSAWDSEHQPYWKKRLEGATSPHWPIDGSAVRSAVGFHRVDFDYDEALSSRLRQLARTSKTTLAVVMCALYVTAVSRWCSQKDFVIPLNMSARHLPEHANMFGYFAEFLHLRIQLTGDEAPYDAVRQIGREFYNSLLHLDCGRVAVQMPEWSRGAWFYPVPGDVAEHGGLPKSELTSSLGLAVDHFSYSSKQNKVVTWFDGIGLMFWERSEKVFGHLLGTASMFASPTVARFAEALRDMADEFACASTYQVVPPADMATRRK